MSRLAVVIAGAALCASACASGGSDEVATIAPLPPAPAPTAPAPPAIVAPVEPPPPAPPAPTFARITAPPGGTILALGVTATGNAAITIDDSDEVRLWPTLDGSDEPVVVDLPAATSVAVARTGDGFAVALGLDGGALVARVDRDGHVRGHAEHTAWDGVVAVADGFVAWHGRELELVDADGASRGTLVAPATVTSVVAAQAAAVATVGGTPRALAVAPFALGAPVRRPAAAVTAKGSDLVLASAGGPRYLGYAFFAEPGSLAGATDAEHVVVHSGSRWLRLDHDLAGVAEVTPWAPPHEHVRALRWLAGDDWLATSESGLSIVQLAAGTGHLALPKAAALAYAPSSQLVLLDRRRLARYQPDRGTLELVRFTAWGSDLTDTELVSPTTPGGALLVQTERSHADHFTMTWIHDLDHAERGATSVRLQNAYQHGATARGQVFVTPIASPDAVDTYFDGQLALPTHAEPFVPSPGGNHELEHGDQTQADQPTTRLTDAASHVQWVQPLVPNALSWLDDARLVYAPPTGGVASVDLATGALVRPHAAWGFELGRAPHPTSSVGRPLARTFAAARDPEIQLASTAAFQQLVRATADASSMRILEWGSATLDHRRVRIALLKRAGESGTPVFAYLYETAPGEIRAIAITGLGFSEFQGFDEPAHEPTWGIVIEPEVGPGHARTVDLTELAVTTRWIHASFEAIAIGLVHGEPVLLSDRWLERENNGHGFDQTSGGERFTHDAPALATYAKLHVMQVSVSAASKDADELASSIARMPQP